MLNGDVLTDVDLPAVLARITSARGPAPPSSSPRSPNPSAYGLVETDADARVLRFVEKPDPAQITTDTINAGIYVLETRVAGAHSPRREPLDRARLLPRPARPGRPRDRATCTAGYWIDIGTPEKYLQVHRDILGGAFAVDLVGPRAIGAASSTPPRAVVGRAPAWSRPSTSARAAWSRPEPRWARAPPWWRGVRWRRARGCATACSGRASRSGPERRVEGALLGPRGPRRAERLASRPGAILGEGAVAHATSRGR